MRVLAVDIGRKRIGIALSDPTGKIASPLTVIEAAEDIEENVRRVADLARIYGAELVVVGLPRTLRGTDEFAAQDASDFASRLAEATGLPVALWDERLTTAQAERALLEAGMRRERRRQQVDKVAAAVILQSYLDAHHGQVEPEAPTDHADP